MNFQTPTADPDRLAAPVTPAPSRAVSGKPRGVAVFGLFGIGNHGNEGSLEVMLDMLRRERPEADILCVCADPARVACDHRVRTTAILPSRGLGGAARLLHRSLFRLPGKVMDFAGAYRTMRRCDVLIVPGTGILDDFCERPTGMPLSILLWCMAARAAGARICMVSIGAGPIRHPLSRRLMIRAAKLADYRSYRDRISKDFMKQAGVDIRRDRVEPDLVFQMRMPAPAGTDRTGDGRPSIGVGVMGYRGWYGFDAEGEAVFSAYIGKMARFVGQLLQSGHDVRLLVGDQGDDRIAIEAILKAVRNRPAGGATIVAEPISSLHDLMAQMARTDIVVATRFHNVVCALKLAKPTISLGYARKNDVLMSRMGLGDYCAHVERFEVEPLLGQVADLIARRGEIEARIEAQTKAFRDRLERQEQRLLAEYLPA